MQLCSPCCSVKPLVLSNRFSIILPETCTSDLSTFPRLNLTSIISHSLYMTLFYGLLRRPKSFDISSTLFTHTTEAGFAYLFPCLLCWCLLVPLLFSNCPFPFIFIEFPSSLHLPYTYWLDSTLRSLFLIHLLFLQAICHGFKLLHKSFLRYKHFDIVCLHLSWPPDPYLFVYWAAPTATSTFICLMLLNISFQILCSLFS